MLLLFSSLPTHTDTHTHIHLFTITFWEILLRHSCFSDLCIIFRGVCLPLGMFLKALPRIKQIFRYTTIDTVYLLSVCLPSTTVFFFACTLFLLLFILFKLEDAILSSLFAEFGCYLPFLRLFVQNNAYVCSVRFGLVWFGVASSKTRRKYSVWYRIIWIPAISLLSPSTLPPLCSISHCYSVDFLHLCAWIENGIIY